jgi:hypothetical protein
MGEEAVRVISNRITLTVLGICASVAFTATLLLYIVPSGRNPMQRIGYAVFVSLVPALLTLLIAKMTNASLTQRGLAMIYAVLFALIVVIQALVRDA